MTNHDWELVYKEDPSSTVDDIIHCEYKCIRCKITTKTEVYFNREYRYNNIWNGDCDISIIEQVQDS